MKKFLATILAAILCISLTACGGTKTGGGQSPEKTEEPQTSTVLDGKVINLICPWAAGGSTDIVARAIAQRAEDILGVPVQVVNREGGGSSIGTQEAALATPDGHTILVATINGLTILPYTQNLSYSVEDFASIGQVCTRDLGIFCLADKPWNDVSDVIEACKADPSTCLMGAATGSLQHVLMLQLAAAGEFELNQYPIAGDSEALSSLLGGTIDVSIPGSIDVFKGQIDSGEVKLLGVLSEERLEAYPDTPTLKELGYDVTASAWTSLLVPAGTPQEIVDELETAFQKVLTDPELTALIEKAGQDPNYQDGETNIAMIRQQYEDFGEVIKESGLA